MAERTTSAFVPVYSTLIMPSRTAEFEESEYPKSQDGKHRILPEQGRKGMNKAPPINLDWIHPDRADHAEVFFAVYRPALRRYTPRDLHWSLAWAIGNTWKQLHVIEEKLAGGPSPQPRYVYWGPLTKSSGPTDDVADRYFLGVFSQAQRKQIEELAAETPVMVPDGTWNCQDWLLDLFERMVDAGIINARTRDTVLKAAGYGA